VDLRFADIDALHRKVTGPYQANRVVAVLSKMLNLAVKWEWCGGNPCKSLERHHEEKRERYLTAEELDRLGKALAACPDQQGCDIIRLLLLTGARSGELRSMRWGDVDLTFGTWTKPASATKQNRLHRVPLGAAARELLERLRRGANNTQFVFSCPSNAAGYRAGVKYTWARLCKTANIENCRIHDLRHTYASVLVSSGHSLPIIGRLLGHTQAATTHRYSHLADDPLRSATEKAGTIITNGTRH
jgi:integrase